MEALISLKNFLADRPEVALLAISLLTNATLLGLYIRSRDTHDKTLRMILPLATRLSDLLALAANKAKARAPAGDSGIRTTDSSYISPAYDHLRGDKP